MSTLTVTRIAVSVQDGVVAEAWGLTDWQWSVLTDSQRADYRDRVVYAPNFKAGN